MSSKTRSTYVCSACGADFAKWVGKCPRCQTFGTVEETAAPTSVSTGMQGTLTAGAYQREARTIDEVTENEYARTRTGVSEFDRVIGGGLVPGHVLLLSGEPGGGKSTLAMQVAATMAQSGRKTLIVSGEESVEQIAARGRRLGISTPNLFLAGEHDLESLLGHVDKHRPDLLVVDSVQTIASPHIDSRAGSVPQVHEMGAALTRLAKTTQVAVIAIAQITKDGGISGPQALVHIVDSVAHLEGDPNTTYRVLRMSKNRFGSAEETATFQHTEHGLEEVLDPSGLFLQNRHASVSGVCPAITMQGRRAIPVEIQALVAPTNSPNPRRGVTGLDAARMAMLQAVTERHGKVRMFDKDTYLATTAGLKVSDTGVDLAACLALASAGLDAPVPVDTVAVGEVTLSGDIRPALNMKARLQEATRLGFTRVLCPPGTPRDPQSPTTLVETPTLADAVRALRTWAGSSPTTND